MGGGVVAVLVPHFDIPFRLDPTGHAVVVEQDSLDDISNCVEAVLRTIVGQRTELPEFGITDPTFELQPIDLLSITNSVLQQEPRAHLLMSQAPGQWDAMVANALALVSLNNFPSANGSVA